MPARLTTAERAYFVRKAGGATVVKPFNQVKRDYIAGFIGGIGRPVSMPEIERRFLQKIAADAGYTPAKYTGDLWRQAVISISQTPGRTIEDNKLKFYLNAP